MKDYANIHLEEEATPPPGQQPKEPWSKYILTISGWILAITLVVYVVMQQLAKPQQQPKPPPIILEKKPEKIVRQQPIDIPEKRQERFEFYEELQQPLLDTTVDIESGIASNYQYWLRTELMGTKQEAEKLRLWLILHGIQRVGLATYTDSNKAVWYRTRLGPFSARSAMNRARDLLVRKDVDSIVERYKGPDKNPQ